MGFQGGVAGKVRRGGTWGARSLGKKWGWEKGIGERRAYTRNGLADFKSGVAQLFQQVASSPQNSSGRSQFLVSPWVWLSAGGLGGFTPSAKFCGDDIVL